MYTSPAVTSSRPAMIRRIVDFPQPEGPTKTMNSPSSISSETSSTAGAAPCPNTFVTRSRTIFATSHLFRCRDPDRPPTRSRPAPAEAPVADRFADPGLRLQRRADPVQADDGRTDDRGNGQGDRGGAGSDGLDPGADPGQERGVARPQHTAASTTSTSVSATRSRVMAA